MLPEVVGTPGWIGAGLFVLAFAVGYVAHELAHIVVIRALGIPHTVYTPDRLRGWVVGGVEVNLDAPAPRRAVVAVALAPLFLNGPVILVWAVILLAETVSATAVVVLIALFVPTFPSMTDWHTAFTYNPIDAQAAPEGEPA